MHLSKLEKVELREVWKHEARDFTQWLAQDDILEILSDEIGIDIGLLQVEASVGQFNVDILAAEKNTGSKIVIENQLETTDHDHLGKIITYASGFDAEFIIWIVKSLRDEHKQAVDWLNDHTDQKINIFVIKMEVWKIADSPYAAKFQVVAKPNDWAKAIKEHQSSDLLSNIKMLQLEFWTQFKEYAQEHQPQLKLRKVSPQHWYDISFRFSNAHLRLTVNSQSGHMSCEVYIPDDKPLFFHLLEQKTEIETALSATLLWEELPAKKASRIKVVHPCELTHQIEWESYHICLLKQVIAFQKVFTPPIKAFSA